MSAQNPQGPPVPGKEQEQLYPPPQGPPQGNTLGGPPHHNQLSQTDNPAAPYELPTQHFPPPPPGPPPSQQQQQQQQPYAQQDPQVPLKEAGILSSSGHAAPPGQKYPAVVEPYDPSTKISKTSPPLGEKPPLGLAAEQDHPPPQPPRPAVAPHHANDVPIPDYDPSHPNYAPPPADQAAYSIPGEAEEHGRHQRGWLAGLGAKAAGPINALANKLGAQSFLPTTMEKECEKAAKILKSFCKEGISSETVLPPPTDSTTGATTGSAADRPVTPSKEKAAQKERGAIVKIPSKVIAKAKGLAIFTTARMGFQLSGATGSGILLARLPDGSWSPPSGIQVHAVGAGFMIGVDIYDCVCVINSRDALAAFMSTRVSLGPDVAVVAGPYGAGGALDFGTATGGSRKSGEHQRPVTPTTPVAGGPQASGGAGFPHTGDDDGKLRPEEKADTKTHRRSASSSAMKPVFSYVKSRGFYAGVQVDGTVITERKEANADFYGTSVPVERILRGEVPQGTAAHGWPAGAKMLYEALKVAEAPKPGEATIVNPPMAAPSGTTVPPPVAGQGQGQYPPGGTTGLPLPGQGQGQYHQGQHQQVPGAVNVPLHRHEEQKGGVPTFPPPPTEETGAGGAPPAYVDDGTAKPGVGDQKTTYQ